MFLKLVLRFCKQIVLVQTLADACHLHSLLYKLAGVLMTGTKSVQSAGL